jgi:hypothetical protein
MSKNIPHFPARAERFVSACRRKARFHAISFLAALLGTASAGWAQPQYLEMPSSGTLTSWSTNPGTIGSGAGQTVPASSGGNVAATFSLGSSVYSLHTNAYFDVSSLNQAAVTIGDSSATVDLQGDAFTVNANSGQIVTFGVRLVNSAVSGGGGLSVSGGGAVAFDNTQAPYASGMDLGAVSLAGSTLTLPAGASFGLANNNGVSDSSITLADASTLVLSGGVVIGSPSISVPLTYDAGSIIQVASGGVQASLTPAFADSSDTLSLDPHGGTLNLYGNNYNQASVTLNINDPLGTGTVELYGDPSGVSGGDDYSGATVTVAAGTLMLNLDVGSQSLSNLTVTGGVVGGAAYTGDVVMSGQAQMNAQGMNMNSLTLSGTATCSGSFSTFNDLDLTDSAVVSPLSNLSAVGGNLGANSGTPEYVVGYDGSNSSNLAVGGSADLSHLQVNLLLASGSYAPGTFDLTVLTATYPGTNPTAAPKLNIAGVFLDSGHTIAATGDEVALSLTQSGNDVHLLFTINRPLYVASSVTTTYVVPFIGGPVLTTDAGAVAFTAEVNTASTPVTVDSGLTIADAGSSTLTSAAVAITAGFQLGGDVLTFTPVSGATGNITASYDSSTGILTMSSAGSTATVAQWQAALRDVTYTNTANAPAAATRTIAFTVTDPNAISSTAATRLVTVTVAPHITTATGPAAGTYAAGQTLAFSLTFNEAVTVAAGVGSPQLAITVSSSVRNAQYVSGSGTGTLLFHYTVQLGDNASSGISVASPLLLNGATIEDAGSVPANLSFAPPNSSSVLISTVPTVMASAGSTSFTAGDDSASNPVAVDGALVITDPSQATLASGTVAIVASFLSAEDVLSFTNDGSTMGNLTAAYNATTGVLTFTSPGATATLAQWQNALRSVTYTDLAIIPTGATRTIRFTVNDGVQSSAPTSKMVTLNTVDQTPVLAAGAAVDWFLPGANPIAVNASLSVNDRGNSPLVSGTVAITGGWSSAQDVLAFVNDGTTMGNISGTYNPATGILSLTSAGGTATLVQWQHALASVTYNDTAASPSSAARTIAFSVSDGLKTSVPALQVINIALSQSITFAGIGQHKAGDAPFLLSASATSGLPVSYVVVSGPASVSGSILTLSGGAGTVTIQASQAGSTTVQAAAPVAQSFAVVLSGAQAFLGSFASPTMATAVSLRSATAASAASQPATSFAGTVSSDGSQGSLIGYLSSLNQGFVFTFAVGSDGRFSGTTGTIGAGIPVTLSISGTITATGISGTIAPLGLTFAALSDAAMGPTAQISGFYSAGNVGTASGGTYAVVGTQGNVFVLSASANFIATGAGTLNAATGAFSVTSASATINGSVSASAGTVTGSVSTLGGTVEFSGTSASVAATSVLVNLSGRSLVTPAHPLITGFVIGGTVAKTVVLRGIGPALSNYAIASPLLAPALTLYDAAGDLLGMNSGWGGASALSTAFSEVGAFGLPLQSADSAMEKRLSPGAYSIVVSDAAQDAGGTALAEIYDASVDSSEVSQRLLDLSSRSQVGPGNPLFAGFAVSGNTPKKVLIRGVGPGLASFGVAGVLANPVLQVYDRTGTLIAQNDDWGTPLPASDVQVVASAADIVAAENSTGAFPLVTGATDAALIINLAPGNYTAIVTGAGGAGGQALVEVYELSP